MTCLHRWMQLSWVLASQSQFEGSDVASVLSVVGVWVEVLSSTLCPVWAPGSTVPYFFLTLFTYLFLWEQTRSLSRPEIVRGNQMWAFLPHAVNCGRFCFWRHQSVVFCLCMKYLGNRWTDLRHIHTEDACGPSLGRVWRSRSKLKGQGHQGQKRHFLAVLAACM